MPSNFGVVEPPTHVPVALDVAAFTPSSDGEPAGICTCRFSTFAVEVIFWVIALPVSGTISVLACALLAPIRSCGIASCVAVLPAPVSAFAHCA